MVEELPLAGVTGEVDVRFDEVSVGPGAARPDVHDLGGEGGA